MGGDHAGLRQHHLSGQVQRGSAHMHRTGAAVTVAALDRLRVGLDEAERLDRQSEPVSGDLRKAGLVALAV